MDSSFSPPKQVISAMTRLSIDGIKETRRRSRMSLFLLTAAIRKRRKVAHGLCLKLQPNQEPGNAKCPVGQQSLNELVSFRTKRQ